MKFCIFTHLFFRPNVFHFEEWLKYHIDFGVDHFYFYESSHAGIPCLQRDTKRDIDIPMVGDIPYKEIYRHFDKIREKYNNYCTFIKWLPKDKNGNYLEHDQINAYEQVTAFDHFYKNYAKKHDRVSTIDCDEFYYSEKYDNIKSFVAQNQQNILLLGCKFFESVFINVGGLVTQKTKCLDKFSRVGSKYIFNPKNANSIYNHSPHFPPVKNKTSVNINQEDLCFYHYKVNQNAKISIEYHGKQKMEYTEDKSISEKALYLKDYTFIEKPKTQQNFIDSEQDILGLDSFKWDEIQN
jgi:hypothetical protein